MVDGFGWRSFQRRNPDNVLRDDIVRLLQDLDRIERPLSHQFCRCRRFHEIIDVGADENSVTAFVERMTGATDPLNCSRDAFRRRHHDDEINRADVDPKLEAG